MYVCDYKCEWVCICSPRNKKRDRFVKKKLFLESEVNMNSFLFTLWRWLVFIFKICDLWGICFGAAFSTAAADMPVISPVAQSVSPFIVGVFKAFQIGTLGFCWSWVIKEKKCLIPSLSFNSIYEADVFQDWHGWLEKPDLMFFVSSSRVFHNKFLSEETALLPIGHYWDDLQAEQKVHSSKTRIFRLLKLQNKWQGCPLKG